MDEHEVVEVVRGDGTVRTVPVGRLYAEGRLKGDYLAGRIEAEDYERELDRLLGIAPRAS